MRLAVIDSSNSGLDASLGYDGGEIVLEGLSSNRTRRYVHGPGVDEPLVAYLVTTTGTSRTWLHADERGSIVEATPDSGIANTAVGRYDEYGVGNGVTRFHYSGIAIAYDAKGNPASDGLRGFGYGNESRLVSASGAGNRRRRAGNKQALPTRPC
jgi:hypothetical protein